MKLYNFDHRVPYLKYWSDRAANLNALVRDPNLRPSRESWEEVRLVEQFAQHVDEILVFLKDVLMPRNLDAQIADNFAAVGQALRDRE